MPSQFHTEQVTLGLRIDRSAWLVAFVVFVGLGVSALEAGPSWSFVIQGAGVGLVYLLLTLGLGDRLVSDRDQTVPDQTVPGTSRSIDPSQTIAAWLYFALQLVVLAVMSTVFARHQTFGVIWLFFMPLVSHARMLLPLAGTLTVCAASLGLMAAHIRVLIGWQGVPTAIFGIATAVAFVLFFTDIAMRESDARAKSQRLGEKLEEANRRLGAYAVQAEELAAARERARMAREIHDSVGHSLTAVHMQIEAARTMLGRDEAKTRDALAKAQLCIQDGLAEIRRSVSALRADPLDGRGLHEALTDLADVSSDSGLPAQLRVSGRPRPLGADTSLVLFRCAQEGLTNARKHARAQTVSLDLDYGDSDNSVRLRVHDDGIGTQAPQGGFGLLGLGERARQLGGRLEFQSAPGEGFALELDIPTPSLDGSRPA